MSASFIPCPLCGAEVFYIQRERLCFFRVCRSGEVLPGEGSPDPGDPGRDGIYCCSCAWHGSLDELVGGL